MVERLVGFNSLFILKTEHYFVIMEWLLQKIIFHVFFLWEGSNMILLVLWFSKKLASEFATMWIWHFTQLVVLFTMFLFSALTNENWIISGNGTKIPHQTLMGEGTSRCCWGHLYALMGGYVKLNITRITPNMRWGPI